jgi:hypothetical protein
MFSQELGMTLAHRHKGMKIAATDALSLHDFFCAPEI